MNLMKPIDDFVALIMKNPGVFIHVGDNGRAGSVFVFKKFKDQRRIAVFYEIYDAGSDRLWEDREGNPTFREAEYAIRNLERHLLVMEEIEQRYHATILQYVPLSNPWRIKRTTESALRKQKALAKKVFNHWVENNYQQSAGISTEENEVPQTNQTEGKRTMTINLKTAAAIVDENITTIEVNLSARAGTVPELYTYLCTQELASTLNEGDMVLLQSTSGPILGRVVSVQSEPNVELNTDVSYRWAFQKVDLNALQIQVEKQERIYELLKAKQRVSTRQSVLANLGLTQDDLKLLA
jgi:preprotein translocase subunit YajC